MIILPSKYRCDNVLRFVECYHKTGASLPLWLIVNHENAYHYSDVKLPPCSRIVKVSTGMRIGDIFNAVFKYYPNEDFYGILADDVTPETFRWDIVLKGACLPGKIAWGFDGGHDETLPRHPFIGGDLVRKLGFLTPPGLKHWYVDNVWRDIATELDCGQYLPEVRMIHRHPSNGWASSDRTYQEQPDHRTDEITYNTWKEQSFPFIIERLKSEDAA